MTRPSSLADLASIYDSQPISGMRNRIINGDMRIDQRNAGAAITSNSGFPVDRFFQFYSFDGTLNAQRSTVAPPGFTNSLAYTVTTPDSSLGATQFFGFRQRIEGFNTADFDFGTANARIVTLSFWVRSSVVGTYSTVLSNEADSRIYPASYSINSANTWEFKTITIPGETTGSWLTNNGIGVQVHFYLGLGSNYLGAVNAWNSSSIYGPTNMVNFTATNGATFYLTGVQLEAGPFATPFERRQFGQELMLCQRYFERWDGSGSEIIGPVGQAFGSASGETTIIYVVEKRAPPVVSTTGSFGVWIGTGNANHTSMGFVELRTRQLTWQYGGASAGSVGQAIQFYASTATASVLISAEL